MVQKDSIQSPPPPRSPVAEMSRHFFCCCKKTYYQIQSRFVNKKKYSNLKEKKTGRWCWILQRSGDENWKKTTCWFWNSVWFVNAAKQIQNTSFSPEKVLKKLECYSVQELYYSWSAQRMSLKEEVSGKSDIKNIEMFVSFVEWFVLFWYFMYVYTFNPIVR